MIEIDGSMGEGGGQVLRSALALSALTRQAVHITHIRLRRPKPGLQAQHLQSVKAAAAVCDGEVEGAAAGSQTLTFYPGELKAGRYRFEIGTAGSTSLVLQTIFLPLCLAGGTSSVKISGGTHVPWSPCFDYLDLQWLPHLRRMGFSARLVMEQAGFYPSGGGLIQATISPAPNRLPLDLTQRGALKSISGISAVADLDPTIATRQKHQALRRLEPRCRETKIKTVELNSPSKGTILLLLATFEHSQCCYFALGEKGKPAERVADEAVDALEAFLYTEGVIDQYLADQLLLPMAMASGKSRLGTSKVTQHLLTNAEVIRRFLPTEITIQGEVGQSGLVEVTPP